MLCVSGRLWETWWANYFWLAICLSRQKKGFSKVYLAEASGPWTEKNSVSILFFSRLLVDPFKFESCHIIILFSLVDVSVGEATGKAGRGVARLIPGPAANLESLNYKAGSVAAEVQKTRQALNERGDKLSMLEDRTQRMANEAENFSNAAHQLMVRCRERKWYQL